MGRETPEIEPGQLKKISSKVAFLACLDLEVTFDFFSVVLTLVSMLVEKPFPAVSFTSG